MGELTATELAILAIIRDNSVGAKSGELPLTHALIRRGFIRYEGGQLALTDVGAQLVQGIESSSSSALSDSAEATIRR
jgi:DNA topoisomerase IA